MSTLFVITIAFVALFFDPLNGDVSNEITHISNVMQLELDHQTLFKEIVFYVINRLQFLFFVWHLVLQERLRQGQNEIQDEDPGPRLPNRI